MGEQVSKNVKKKIDLGIYQGKRHNLGYPVRGQRTLSNGKTQKKLYKFRFHYASELFTHTFFKNQRKIARLKKQKEEKLKKQEQQQAYRNQIMVNNSIRNHIKKKEKEKADNEAYLEKLAKIKAERKKQVESKFIKAHKEAQK